MQNNQNHETSVIATVKPESKNVQFKLPEGIKAWCHPCNQGFASLDELNDHVRDKHRIYKG